MSNKSVVIIGAGPAGLAAAHELIGQNIRPIVLEKSNKVGGISRTENYNGYYVDIGGHRFLTKIETIGRLWKEMLHEDFLKVPRLSRIYYQNRFLHYPLKFHNVLSNLGIYESVRIILSYFNAQFNPNSDEKTFEQWVSNRFGKRLYNNFFKTYTEKVWGIPCNEIQASWAAQRIKGLSLTTAVINALFGVQNAKTLVNEFYYPTKGPGMMWQRFQEVVNLGEGQVLLNSEATRLLHDHRRIKEIKYIESNKPSGIPVSHIISSIPITRLVTLLEPQPPVEILEAAQKLSYRDFVIVLLVVDKKELFSDQWIYIHSQDVQVARIQNFKNWSAAMVPDPDKTSVGMEYFCQEGDEIWTMQDVDLADLAARELYELGLTEDNDILDSFVIRQPKAYPVYDKGYDTHLDLIRNFLGSFENLQTIGRNGLHRYNNMDHSMQTGIFAAQNIAGANHDLWTVTEAEKYLEEDTAARKKQSASEKIIARTFARIDPFALATAVGTVSGVLIFLATIWPVLKGSNVLLLYLRLLAQYFVGYTVTVKGAFIALGYSFFWGFLFGWLFAYLRNLFLSIYIYRAKKKAELLSLRDFLEHF